MTCERSKTTLVALALLGWSAVSMDAAQAAADKYPPSRYVAFCDSKSDDGQGPDNACVHVLEIGAVNPRRIVVLVPGGSEGAATLLLVGRSIAMNVPRTQVWAVERREQNLSDLSELGSAAQLDYYLNNHYRHLTPQESDNARRLGLATTISDLHRVIVAARAEGRNVYLGGHSWGATIALAYAAWDFDGRAGYQNLSGLILIDGGVHDSFAGEGYKFDLTIEDAKKKLYAIETGSPFTGDLGYLWQLKGPPESVPIDYQLAADLAAETPNARSPLQSLLPKVMQPTKPVSNGALLGWLIDNHAPVADLQAHSGHFAFGDPQGWTSDGPAGIADIAQVFARKDPAALEWYWPRRLTLDLEAVDPFVASPVTELLGLPIRYGSRINVPMFVFETGLTHGTVVSSAKWVEAHSEITQSVYVTDETMSHLDPLLDAPGTNKFLTTVIAFLKERQR